MITELTVTGTVALYGPLPILHKPAWSRALGGNPNYILNPHTTAPVVAYLNFQCNDIQKLLEPPIQNGGIVWLLLTLES
jgi:hypothetical protein